MLSFFKVLFIIACFFLVSCSENASIQIDRGFGDGDVRSRTYNKDGELIGINMMATTCSTLATEGTAYSCSVGTSGGEEFIYMETANTCTWATADTIALNISGTPTAFDVGTCDLVFTRIDLGATFTTFTFSIVVGSGGAGFTIADTSLNEDSAFTEIRSDADVQAPTEGSGSYSFDHLLALSPKCVDNGIIGINENTGAIDFYPYPNYSGVCNIRVNFDDGSIETATFQLTVNPVNDIPVIDFLCADEILQDDTLSTFPSFTEIDGDTLSWSAGASNTCGWSSVNATTGEITGTPSDNDVGSCILSLVANDGVINSLEVTRTITIENIRPTLSIADQVIDPSGGVFNIADFDVQADEEGFGSYSLSATAPGVACVDQGNIVAINSTTGEITYTPNPSFEFICHIEVIFDDGNASRSQVAASFAINTLQAPEPVQNIVISAPAINSISSTPTASWDPPATFFDHYEVALGTSPGDDDIVAFTDIGYSTSHMFTGLSLTECFPYHISVIAVDVTGTPSSSESVVFYGDVTAPTVPSSLILGTNRFLPNGDANSTSWTASTDNCSLDHYEVALGTTTSTADMITWTNVGLVTTHQFTGFTGIGFNRIDDYFNLVQAVDAVGNTSAISPVPAVAPGWMFPEYTYRRDITFANPTPQNEFQIEIVLDSTNFDDSFLQADGDDIRFYDTSDTLLEYHLVEFIQGELAKFIVKIPTTGTTAIYAAYENPTVIYGGDEDALNSSFIRDLYAAISSNANVAMNVHSYVDNNEIQINGATNYVLALQYDSIVTANVNTHTVVGARGPISARANNNDNDHDILPAISLAGVDFINSYTRVSEVYEFYNPNSIDANVNIFDVTTSGVAIKDTTVVVPALGFLSTGYDTTIAIIESDIPVVSFTRGGNDAVQLFEVSQDIFGIPSNIGNFSFTTDGTTATVYWTDGTTETFMGDRGDQVTLTASGNQMSGDGVRIIADNPIAGRQTADSDGSEASSFHPREKLDKKYVVPKDSQYIAVICHQPGTNVTLTDGGLVDVRACPATATHPGKIYFNALGAAVSYNAGTIIESESSFFAVFENSNQQETNLLGPSVGIPYSENPINPSIGVQVNN